MLLAKEASREERGRRNREARVELAKRSVLFGDDQSKTTSKLLRFTRREDRARWQRILELHPREGNTSVERGLPPH